MTVLFVLLAFVMGAGFGCMATAGVMLALAVNKEADAKVFDGRDQ